MQMEGGHCAQSMWKAAKLFTKRWSDHSVSLISNLNWSTLCSCWSKLKIWLCRRIIMKESIIFSPLSYFTPPPHLNPRSHHHCSVCVPFARTASFQSSFFLFLPVICGTVFLGMLSAYHHLVLLRQHCCIYLVLFNVSPLSLALYIYPLLFFITYFTF